MEQIRDQRSVLELIILISAINILGPALGLSSNFEEALLIRTRFGNRVWDKVGVFSNKFKSRFLVGSP